ncbi:hypothetical protein H8C17_002623 [Salmonella enterica]|nr:hypothetical protein [Salmonella enterica]
MSDNVKNTKNNVSLADVKRDAFYFIVLFCLFLMSLTKFTSTSESIYLLALRALSFFVLIICVARYGAIFIENALIYIKYKEGDNND